MYLLNYILYNSIIGFLEVMQPDPDDYVTPVRMQRLMNTATVTTSTSRSSTSGQNFKNQVKSFKSMF